LEVDSLVGLDTSLAIIDALYEARTLLIASAAVPPDEIYLSGDGAWEFRRTVSRLHEMQSEDYIANRSKG
jgi:cell division protein ZapE